MTTSPDRGRLELVIFDCDGVLVDSRQLDRDLPPLYIAGTPPG
jgi:hypothetical protein